MKTAFVMFYAAVSWAAAAHVAAAPQLGVLTPKTVEFDFAANGLLGKWSVRDVWRQKTVDTAATRYSVEVWPHATQLVRLAPTKGAKVSDELHGDIREMAWRRIFKLAKPFDPASWDCPECRVIPNRDAK